MSDLAKSGFTLIELMVAMVAGAFAVAGVYYLNGVSSRSFAEQMRVSETQMSLRSAMEQLRRDFARAGYLHTPNSQTIPDCNGTIPPSTNIAPTAMQAISITASGSTAGSAPSAILTNTLLAPAANNTRADIVDTWGNYATPDMYLVDPVGSTTATIVFQPSTESFRRSFFDPAVSNGAANWNAARFGTTFAVGRMVRLENEGRYFFRYITGVNTNYGGDVVGSAWPSITVAALPNCFVSSAWTAVSPVLHYRYSVQPDSTANLGRLQSAASAAGTAPIGAQRTLLVREEWNDSTGTPAVIPFTERVILDYAIEFSVDAFTNTSIGGALPAWALTQGAALTALSASTGTPQALRSLMVTLTARSAEVDPKLPSLARTVNAAPLLNGPLMVFRVTDPNSALVLNARTRTLRSEIFLQNL